MVKLTFEFNKAEVAKRGLTEDKILLSDVRDYAKNNGIAETSYGVFEKDGDEALCSIMIIADQILLDNPRYMNCLKSLELEDENGEKENCIDSVKRWLEEKKK